MRLHLYVSAAVLISASALAEPHPYERINTLMGECFWGDVASCHELEQLNMQVGPYEILNGTAGSPSSITNDQECNRATNNG
ncbi:hypothetical protein, partial [Falsiroseomonas sp. E2-1-a20]|uniref:hypothetical protein n=1 Tax=Falsiroseomonas sp. E2-1-a20 TaxID=3239300 RepID=UPI003F3213C9